MKTFTVTVIEDEETNDLILPFPQELIDHMDWEEGDTLLWHNNGNGTYSLSKAEKD